MIFLGKKITLQFEFGKSTFVLIAVAVLAGYAIGNFYPFGEKEEGLASDDDDQTTTTTQTLGQQKQQKQQQQQQQQQPPQNNIRGFGPQDIKKWASEIGGLDMNQFNSCFDSQKYLNKIRSDYKEGLALEVRGTPAFLIGTKEDGSVSVTGAQPYSVFKKVIDSYLKNDGGKAPKPDFNLKSDPIRNAPVIGKNKDAQVLITEFSDFQCAFCRAFYTETLPKIEREYIDTGKVVLVYRDFPLTSIHPGAVDYALAAECAQEQGKWREMHDKIFDEQNKLGLGTIPYG